MPYWYYDKNAFYNTPSIQDGIDYDTEYKYRKEGARFIIEIGTVLELGYNTWATGVVFFHRFYMFQSLKIFPHYVTACCCLFLAGKVEETPKKCKDIIKVAQSLISEENFKTFGKDPKEEVMTLERILLQTMKFDLKVQHPYSYLTRYAKCLKGDKNKLQKMVQMAWTFINDSLCTTLSVQWEPEIIAIALMYLATKLSKFKVINWAHRKPNQLKWWEVFVKDLPMNILEDICHQVLDLYSPEKNENNSGSSTEEKNPLQSVIEPVNIEKTENQKLTVPLPAQIVIPLAAIKQEVVKVEKNTTKTESLIINNEPVNTIKTEPLCIKYELPSTINTESFHIKNDQQIPDTPMISSSTIVSAENTQNYSPSSLPSNLTQHPLAFEYPTAVFEYALCQNNKNVANSWKTDMQTNDRITENNGYQHNTNYSDNYNNNNYQKKFRDPKNAFKNCSNWDNKNWKNSNFIKKTYSTNFNDNLRNRKYSKFSNDAYLNHPYLKSSNGNSWDAEAHPKNFKKDFNTNTQNFFKKRSFYNR